MSLARKDNKPQHVFRKETSQSQRVETGGLQFEDDWPGYFIRGDECVNFATSYRRLKRAVESIPEQYRNIFLPPLRFLAEHVHSMAQQTIGQYIPNAEAGTIENTSQFSRSGAERVIEPLYLAVEHLATLGGDVRDRLKSAGLTLLTLRAEEFPEEVQDDFRWVKAQLTRFKSQFNCEEGSIEATMNRIRNSTGKKIAQRIFQIYEKIQDIRAVPIL